MREKTINYHRQLLIKKLIELQKINKLDGIIRNKLFNESSIKDKTFLKAKGRLSLKEYNYLMSLSKFGLSLLVGVK